MHLHKSSVFSLLHHKEIGKIAGEESVAEGWVPLSAYNGNFLFCLILVTMVFFLSAIFDWHFLWYSLWHHTDIIVMSLHEYNTVHWWGNNCQNVSGFYLHLPGGTSIVKYICIFFFLVYKVLNHDPFLMELWVTTNIGIFHKEDAYLWISTQKVPIFVGKPNKVTRDIDIKIKLKLTYTWIF